MKPTILFLESIDPAAMSLLAPAAYDIVLPGSPLADYSNVQAIVTRGKGRVDRALIDRCPALRVIARCGVGLDAIDVDYATTRGVQVVNVPGANAATVAEHTLGLMLMLVRGMYRLVREVKDDNWDYRNDYAEQELRGLTCGIIGMGNIGTRVGTLAGMLGMEVKSAGRDPAAIERLLKDSNVVSLHVPLTEKTRGMINENALSMMIPESYLINTARAEVVDATALLEALQGERLAGYASDLLPVGPPEIVAELMKHPAVLITPHAASLTTLTYREISVTTVRNVLRYLHGQDAAPARPLD
ncbi:Hydroxypyruvate reductase [Neolewinella maritima]|uniref:Hydroxypyruvate reductase n=1 Tax=Neolewinella maritima TaxID=1383882 RepID=A0ABM9B552_9BACT|nr:NAD(P)-dependent oxidoreductase [Neolewinella maritima]CAH1002509.1 Hydroxypyruvate reductase [Neolewinella maritima]